MFSRFLIFLSAPVSRACRILYFVFLSSQNDYLYSCSRTRTSDVVLFLLLNRGFWIVERSTYYDRLWISYTPSWISYPQRVTSGGKRGMIALTPHECIIRGKKKNKNKCMHSKGRQPICDERYVCLIVLYLNCMPLLKRLHCIALLLHICSLFHFLFIMRILNGLRCAILLFFTFWFISCTHLSFTAHTTSPYSNA